MSGWPSETHGVVQRLGMSLEGDPWWGRLVSSLASLGEVSQRDPHGLVVAADLGDEITIELEIIMTADEWDDLVSISWGDIDSAAQHVRQLVLGQPRDQRYLVYSYYMLVPSKTPELPARPGLQRLQELAATYPDGVIPNSGWFAYTPGNESRQ